MCNIEYVRRHIPIPPPRLIPLPTPPASTSLMLTTKTNSPVVISPPPVSTALIFYTNTDSPMLIQEPPAAPIHVLQAEHEPAHEDNDKTRTHRRMWAKNQSRVPSTQVNSSTKGAKKSAAPTSRITKSSKRSGVGCLHKSHHKGHVLT